jgi:signal peptidase I
MNNFDLIPDPQQAPGEATKTANDHTWRSWLRETLQVVVPALGLALVVHLFLAQATVVFGQSMEPNLSAYQRLIIDKLSYHFQPPARNDIVVIDLPEMDEMLVKRVVGLPGETVELRNGIVLVDGYPLDEAFPHDLSLQNMPRLRLGALEYFVLGDNRGNSNDSRSFGAVKREYIVGRVWLRYWPLHQFKYF